VTGVNTTDVSVETYLQLGSNNIVRLHSVLLASQLNWLRRDADADIHDDDGELRPLIRSSLLSALSSLPLRDVVHVCQFNVVVNCWSSTSHQLDIPAYRLESIGRRSFPVAASTLWNTLPSEIQSSPSLTPFRQRLKTYLFQKSFPDVLL